MNSHTENQFELKDRGLIEGIISSFSRYKLHYNPQLFSVFGTDTYIMPASEAPCLAYPS